MVGSSVECEVVLKSKYISRRQMMIIESIQSDKIKQSESSKYNYFMVCLSLTNFTSMSYSQRTKAGTGLIFFAHSVKY